ncbi:MAG: hypothetical protein PHP48_07350, partial [Bacteroidales bacterium]|nr:hypothetical protein [Bacteroidales bacterium]
YFSPLLVKTKGSYCISKKKALRILIRWLVFWIVVMVLLMVFFKRMCCSIAMQAFSFLNFS